MGNSERGRQDKPRSSRGRAMGLALVVVALGCLPTTEDAAPVVPSPGPPPPPADPIASSETPVRGDPAVVLVVLDGARWQDVFEGADSALASAAHVDALSAEALMPHLHALLADRGAALGAPEHGDPITASGPNFVSLPGYTELFTGRRRHPCADNDCPAARERTIFDEAAAGADLGDVAVFASWDRLERAATADASRIVLSTGRSRSSNEGTLGEDETTRRWLEEGRAVGPYPGHGDFRPDRYTAGLALRYLETKRPRLMFLGLGETDEFAHRGDYAGYLEALRSADRVLGELLEVVGRMGSRGRQTTVIVTADHGRARDYRFHGRHFPESSRVWLVAAGGRVEARGLLRSECPHHLADVAPTVRLLLGLPASPGPARGAPLAELFGVDVLAEASAEAPARSRAY